MVVIASSRRGGLSCTPFCTSFLDGLKLFIYFVYLLLQAYRFIMTLSRFISSLAVVELLPRRLLPLVVLTWLMGEAVELVELGLERQQTLFALFERGAESLDLVLRVILRTLSEVKRIAFYAF